MLLLLLLLGWVSGVSVSLSVGASRIAKTPFSRRISPAVVPLGTSSMVPPVVTVQQQRQQQQRMAGLYTERTSSHGLTYQQPIVMSCHHMRILFWYQKDVDWHVENEALTMHRAHTSRLILRTNVPNC